MTSDDAPILLFVAFFVVVALWSARRIVPARVARVAGGPSVAMEVFILTDPQPTP